MSDDESWLFPPAAPAAPPPPAPVGWVMGGTGPYRGHTVRPLAWAGARVILAVVDDARRPTEPGMVWGGPTTIHAPFENLSPAEAARCRAALGARPGEV